MADLTVSAAIDTFMGSANIAAMRSNLGLPAVDVSSYATGGDGSIGNPWTGWDTAITWQVFTRYHFLAGYYSFATSPNYGLKGIELTAEPGAVLVHTGTGPAMIFDAGASSVWVGNIKVDNMQVDGNTAALVGTIGVTNGSVNVVGTGTNFLTSVAVGDAITISPDNASADSYVVATVVDDTNLTFDRVYSTTTASGLTVKVCKTSYGFYIRGVEMSVFDRCRANNVAIAGMYTEAFLVSSVRLFRVTNSDAGPSIATTYSCRPQHGIVFAGRGADWTTTINVEEATFVGMQRTGYWFKADSYGCTVINGVAQEGKNEGIRLDGVGHQIISTDVESNTSWDIISTGSRNCILNVNSFSSNGFTTSGSVSTNSVIGGIWTTLTLASGSSRCSVKDAAITTFTDSGSNNLYQCPSGTDLRARVGILRRITTAPGSGTVAADCRLTERVQVSISSTCTMSAPTNPTNGDEIEYVFHNNSGGDQTIVWNAVFVSLTGATLPVTISTTKTLYVLVEYSSFWAKWHCKRVVGN